MVHHSDQMIGGVQYRVHDVWVNADSSGWLQTDIAFDITSGLGIYHDVNNTAASPLSGVKYEPTAATIAANPDTAYDTYVTDHNGYGGPSDIDLLAPGSFGDFEFQFTDDAFSVIWAPFDAAPIFTGAGDFRIARISIAAGSTGTAFRGQTRQSVGGVVETEVFLGATITGDIIDGLIVPEPSTFVLLWLGLLSLLGWGGWRRRQPPAV